MIPKATKVPAPIGTSSTRGEPANPSIKSKTPSATSTEGKGRAPEMGVAASCVARASGALIAGAARTERLLLSGTCLCAGAAWNADADSTAQSTRKDLIADDMAVDGNEERTNQRSACARTLELRGAAPGSGANIIGSPRGSAGCGSKLPDIAVSAIRSSMAALGYAVGDAVELLKGGAARPVPARCSTNAGPPHHGLCLSLRSTATRTLPPCPNVVARRRPQAPSGARAPPGS